jgi:hypothetical protein
VVKYFRFFILGSFYTNSAKFEVYIANFDAKTEKRRGAGGGGTIKVSRKKAKLSKLAQKVQLIRSG